MPYIDVRIIWDEPDDKFWMNPDNLKLCLRASCPNTNFQVVYLTIPETDEDKEQIDDLHRIAMDSSGGNNGSVACSEAE